MAARGQLLLASDLDGTLLDHDDYRFDAARSALARLRALQIPLVLNSSKTRDELIALRRRLQTDGPFVVENGSAIFVPVGRARRQPPMTRADGGFWIRELGVGRAELLARLAPLRRRFRFDGFADWSVAQLAEITGLGLAEAERARQRDYSEPLRWHDSAAARQTFAAALHAQGLKLVQGGRFLHLLGPTDKGVALRLLRDWLTPAGGPPPLVVALGDGDNDIDMLEVADIAVRVRSPVHPPPRLTTAARVVTSDAIGPAGWAEVVHALLDERGDPAMADSENRHG